MAFKVEDGTGLVDSTSYVSTADTDAYFVDRANATWATLANAAKQAALIKATDYIDGMFRFIGTKYTQAQALQWPRSSAYDPDGVIIEGLPNELKKACYEYALRASAAELAPDPEYTDSGSILTMAKDQVGPVTEERRYASYQPSTIRAYPMADAMLRHLTIPSGEIFRG